MYLIGNRVMYLWVIGLITTVYLIGSRPGIDG